MGKIKHTRPIEFIDSIHVDDEKVFTEFLNSNSDRIGCLKHLGTFIDNVSISNEFGVYANLKFLIVQRDEYKEQSPGRKYSEDHNSFRDIFESSYDLPESFPKKQTKPQNYVLKSSVQTYSCDPNMNCSKCSGSGKCKTCEGQGFKTCNSCNGKGKKEERVHNMDGIFYKNVDCHWCSGKGRKSCSVCKDSGRCGSCNGRGLITCDKCEGTSNYQAYTGYSSVHLSRTSEISHSKFEDIIEVIPKTKNTIVFDDILVECVNQNHVSVDRRNEVLSLNHHLSPFLSDLAAVAKLKPNQRIGRVYSIIETVPITTVDYSFEGKEYQLRIVGENNIVCFREIPKKHGYRPNIFKRVLNLFGKKKRQIAFVYLASYMFNADGHFDDKEKQMMQVFLNHIKLKAEEKNELTINLRRSLTLEELLPYIKNILGDKRALVFAWQCVMQDGEINNDEVLAFEALIELFKVNEDEVDQIKQKATKFTKLNDDAMLEEYFKA